jgi:molecular chaperone GrpE
MTDEIQKEMEPVTGSQPQGEGNPDAEEALSAGEQHTAQPADCDAVDDDAGEAADPVVVLEKTVQEQKDKYLRLMAEFDNYKRRTSREYDRMVEAANERLMLDLVEVRENFSRALQVADEKHEFKAFLDGMKLIFNKLEDQLRKNGLAIFTETGDAFNPELHDAMIKVPHPEIPEDHIVQVYERGYTLNNRVIKHAKVIVSAGSAAGDDQKAEEAAEDPETNDGK